MASLYTLEYYLKVKLPSFVKLQGVFASRFYLFRCESQENAFPLKPRVKLEACRPNPYI